MFFSASTPPARFSIPLTEGLLPWVVTVSQSPSLPSRPPRSAMPDNPFCKKYPSICHGFLLQCSLYFAYQMGAPTTKRAKVATVISLLTRLALEWANAIWERGEEELSYERFRVVFDHPSERGGEQLFQLQEGAQTTAEYSLTFRTVAASRGWNEPVLRTLFRSGLHEEVQTELACRDDNISLDALIAMAIHLDNLLRSVGVHLATPLPALAVLMQSLNPWRWGHTPLRGRAASLETAGAPYCGQEGHQLQRCPVRPNPWSTRAEGRPRDYSIIIISHQTLSVPISLAGCPSGVVSTALVDSGDAGNFINQALASSLKLPSYPLSSSFPVQALDMRPLGSGTITQVTAPLTLTWDPSTRKAFPSSSPYPHTRSPLASRGSNSITSRSLGQR